MVKIAVLGDVPPQANAVANYLGTPYWVMSDRDLFDIGPDLVIVAGYRRLVPPAALALPRLGCIGFHSAKLPEYPGRAPIPWTLLRGDSHVWNTMLYLDAGVDSGDIIDAESRPIEAWDTPDTLYQWVAESDVRLLDKHLAAILAGIAPRAPQDPAKRGPLTTRDGWAALAERDRLAAGHG